MISSSLPCLLVQRFGNKYTAEIIVNTVFVLIGFYEDSRTWTNVNPIGRFMTV